MSSRTRIRPRTKVYDTNYSIGESYYKDAINRLDRKYSGRPTSPVKQPSVPLDIVERHDQAFADEDLPTARRRAEKHIVEDNLFDNIRSRPLSIALGEKEGDFDQEIANSLQKIQARKKLMAAAMSNDIDMETTVGNITAKRMVKRTEKLLDSVGLNENSARKLFDEESTKRRAIKMTSDNEGAFTKWTAVRDDEETSAAAHRAKVSRARLHDLEDEMEQMAERQAAREKRLANLRALMAENAEESEALQTRSARIVARTEKKTVTF